MDIGLERLVQINLERPYLKNDAEDIEQSAAAAELEKKRSQWVERIEAAGQGGPDLFGGLLEQPQQNTFPRSRFSRWWQKRYRLARPISCVD